MKSFFPHPKFTGIFVNKSGKIKTKDGEFDKLKQGQIIKIDDVKYYDFEFYSPISEKLNISVQKQITPIHDMVYKIKNGYYDLSKHKKMKYVYETNLFGLDEFNNVYDILTNEIISKKSRVFYKDKDLSRTKLIYRIIFNKNPNQYENIITKNPFLKNKYTTSNLIVINKFSESILLSNGEYFKSSEFEDLYVNKDLFIFNAQTNHAEKTKSDYFTIYFSQYGNKINILKAYLVYQTFEFDFVNKDNFNFLSDDEIIIDSTGEIYNIKTNTLNGQIIEYKQIDIKNIKRHPIYSNYGLDKTNDMIYSFGTKHYISKSMCLSIWHEGKKITVNLIQFINECLNEE